jgi:16S rRNA (adenine1518-N6/adenine1519-N6)-dimethyltransferase
VSGLLTPATIQASLAAHRLTPSRALGQNFLADPNTARRIVRLAAVNAGDTVIEVGPGLGSLTLALVEAGARVVAVELDRHVLAALESNLGDTSSVEIVNADALTVDWDTLIADGHTVAMVANLPYNIATPMVIRALETTSRIERFLVMVQREVGERLAAVPRTKSYGAVTVKVAYYGSASVVGLVPANVFIPKPNVESALVEIVRHSRPPVSVADPEAMFALVRAGFATRRKMLRQSLKGVLGDATIEVIERAGLLPTARAEELDLTAWAALTNAR